MLLEVLQLTSLEKRRLRGDLIEVYKLVTRKENIDYTDLLQLDDSGYGTRGQRFKLKRSRLVGLDTRKNFSSNRIVSHWNSLPSHIVGADSVIASRSASMHATPKLSSPTSTSNKCLCFCKFHSSISFHSLSYLEKPNHPRSLLGKPVFKFHVTRINTVEVIVIYLAKTFIPATKIYVVWAFQPLKYFWSLRPQKALSCAKSLHMTKPKAVFTARHHGLLCRALY